MKNSGNTGLDYYRNPWVAAAWSLFLPGFGQLYNKDYLVGILLMAWEIVINTKANINMSVYFTLMAQPQKAHEVLNFKWALFYPSVYAFSMWHAYNQAKNINLLLKEKGVLAPKKMTHHNGLFMGFLLGLFFGIQWCFGGSPTSGGVSLGLTGALVGLVIEKILTRN